MLIALLEKACVVVTLAFVLTRTRFFAHLLRPKLPRRDQVTALAVFLVMAVAEEYVARPATLMNARIIAVCASGLLAGPWTGGTVGVVVTALSCAHHGFPPVPIGASMLLGGVAGGMLHRWQRETALLPAAGMAVGAGTSLLRYALALVYGVLFGDYGSAHALSTELQAAIIQGGGVALVLLVVQQVRLQQAQACAAAMAEVRALQARMQPHFLFNALNTLSALSIVEPSAVPHAAARLGVFLRASLDQHERPLIPLYEELEVVDAYVAVEALRLDDRLSVHCEIDAAVRNAAVPPFLLQPLVENAVRHGLEPLDRAGAIHIRACRRGDDLLLTVSDTGSGLGKDAQERLFREDGAHVHALTLLRRRLRGLYGDAYELTLTGERGKGTTAAVRIPLMRAEAPDIYADEFGPRRAFSYDPEMAHVELLTP